MNRNTGTYVSSSQAGETVRAFVPKPLPPGAPALNVRGRLKAKHDAAMHALRRLELATELVPSADWFLYAFVRKEAVISSQIEGTQASLMDLLSVEGCPEQPERVPDDVHEVSNNVRALEYALREINRPRGLPLSIRLLNGAHSRLLKGVRGGAAQPGEIRRSQNWIGGTRPGNALFVPPPPDRVPELLDQLERYIHAEDELPPLIRTAVIHAQFETIHPYLDGNGRIGRLLIMLLLDHWKLLASPILYLSLYFKRFRSEYYRLLTEVRTRGNWEGWVEFFMDGTVEVAGETVDAARQLFQLIEQDRQKVLNGESASVSALRLFQQLPSHPILSLATACDLLNASKPTAGKAIELLRQHHILKEVTGRKKGRIYAYDRYLQTLKADTDATYEP